MLVERVQGSQQFTTMNGEVVAERIVPGGLEVNGPAVLALLVVVYVVLLGGMD